MQNSVLIADVSNNIVNNKRSRLSLITNHKPHANVKAHEIVIEYFTLLEFVTRFA